jgi:hypothetical protein
MPDQLPGIRVFALTEPVLTSAAVASVERALRADRTLAPTVIDCAPVASVTPSGLAALLELGRASEGAHELALAGLGRLPTLMAVQAGLAERFAIYASVAAFQAEQRALAAADPLAPEGPP